MNFDDRAEITRSALKKRCTKKHINMRKCSALHRIISGAVVVIFHRSIKCTEFIVAPWEFFLYIFLRAFIQIFRTDVTSKNRKKIDTILHPDILKLCAYVYRVHSFIISVKKLKLYCGPFQKRNLQWLT